MRLQLAEPSNTLLSGRALQPAADAARDDDGLPVRRAGDGRLRQLLRAADDRRAGHGVPAAERALLLAAAGRRDRVLRHALLPPARGRLVELPAAVEHRVLAKRRPGRLDLPDPPDRHLLAARRDQLLRDDRQHARARDELGPPAAVHLGDPGLRDPADHRAAGGRRGGHDAADRPPLRDPLVRSRPRTARRSSGSTCSGSSATPRSTSWSCPASGSSPRSSRCSRASRSSATRRSPRRPR